MSAPSYPVETLDEEEDNGTMPGNVQELADAVVGHRIVSAVVGSAQYQSRYWDREVRSGEGLIITLDDGTRVLLEDSSDCCAHTTLHKFLLNPERVDHVITGVGTTGEYTRWHIYADMADVLELEVGWSCGNPFYYGYGFDINVIPLQSNSNQEASTA